MYLWWYTGAPPTACSWSRPLINYSYFVREFKKKKIYKISRKICNFFSNKIGFRLVWLHRCASNGMQLCPPPDYGDPDTFSWPDYLLAVAAKAVPTKNFVTRPPRAFVKGMRLEALDRRNAMLMRVATVVQVSCRKAGMLILFWEFKKKNLTKYWEKSVIFVSKYINLVFYLNKIRWLIK